MSRMEYGTSSDSPPSYEQVTNPVNPQLSYVDVLPSLLSSGGMFSKPRYQPFHQIMVKANRWLHNHPDMCVRTCESLEVKYHPGEANLNTEKSTYFERGKGAICFVRCLRMWVLAKGPHHSPEPQQLGYMNVVPRCIDSGGVLTEPKFENLAQTIERVNNQFKSQDLPGRILTVETQDMKFSAWGSFDADKSCWIERGNRTTYFLNVIRIFYELGAPGHEMIGCADFVPDWLDQGGFLSHGKTEPLSAVVEKAQRWLALQQGIRLSNVQSVDYKTSSWNGSGPVDTQRSLYREYGGRRTEYLRIIRLAYTKTFAGPATISDPIFLTYKTFMPCQMSGGGVLSIAAYETMNQTLRRASAWLNHSGVRIISAETVTIRMHSGNQHLNPEQTYTWEPGNRSEHFLYILRVYMDGIPRELLPPPREPRRALNAIQDADCCTLL